MYVFPLAAYVAGLVFLFCDACNDRSLIDSSCSEMLLLPTFALHLGFRQANGIGNCASIGPWFVVFEIDHRLYFIS